ncbi:ribonuclease P protein component [Rubrivirga sp.]|uniref:ribonuclease P protein component n=1 Tax=Rubrivirga sp. TaxID=1885344 RepID=UPI003B52B241
MRPAAFPRSRRLKRRRLLRPLFERDRADVERVRAGTVVLLARTVPRAETGHDVGLQVGFAPGRRRTNALRTRVRRLLRETFRLHQGPLLDRFGDRPDALTVMVLFRGRDDTAAEDVRRDLPRALARLADRDLPLTGEPSDRERP